MQLRFTYSSTPHVELVYLCSCGYVCESMQYFCTYVCTHVSARDLHGFSTILLLLVEVHRSLILQDWQPVSLSSPCSTKTVFEHHHAKLVTWVWRIWTWVSMLMQQVFDEGIPPSPYIDLFRDGVSWSPSWTLTSYVVQDGLNFWSSTTPGWRSAGIKPRAFGMLGKHSILSYIPSRQLVF